MSFTFIYLAMWVGGHGVTCHGIHVEIIHHVDPWDRTQFIGLGAKLLLLSFIVGLG